MSHKPPRNVLQVGGKIDLVVPQSLRKDAGPRPHLLVLSMNVAEFAPHAGLPSDDVHSLVPGVKLVDVPPLNVSLVGSPVPVAEPHVEVGLVIVGEDDFVGPAYEVAEMGSESPPLKHIILLQGKIDGLVGPVDGLFGWSDGSPNCLLFLPVHGRQLFVGRNVVFDHILFDCRSQVPTTFDRFVPPEMNIRVFEKLVDIVHDTSHYLVCEVESWVELAIVKQVAFHDYFLQLITPAPRFSMGRSVNLHHYSHSSALSIAHDLLDIALRIGSCDLAELAEFWDGHHLHGETVLIDDVPVQDVHFAEHQAINALFYGCDREEVPGGVDHDPSPLELGLIIDDDGNALDEVIVIVELE